MVDNIKLAARRTYEEIFPNADLAALADVVHPDCIDHEGPGPAQGLEGVRRTMLWLNSVFSDQCWEIDKLIAEGDTVALSLTLTARHTGELMGIPATNRTVSFKMMHFIRFEGGKGIEHWGLRDDLSLMRQLGALSEKKRPA